MITLKIFSQNYYKNLFLALNKLNLGDLDKASKLIFEKIKNKKTIFVCGNGGSAAIANHYVCDFLKFFRQNTNYKPKIVSLSNNVETITAISNDIDYKKIFSYQAESLCNKDDLILIISSSGNSKNIIDLLKYAKKNKIKTIGFCGFKGGYLKKNSDISIHVKSENYGISEDSHHILMHLILQYLIKTSDKN
jgi:D-sedoheptulose 7-phosphate isomerase